MVDSREADYLQRPDGEIEIEGERLEMYYGPTVQRLEMDGTWGNLLQAKVGSIFYLYMADRIG
jgi:hypothetical protein